MALGSIGARLGHAGYCWQCCRCCCCWSLLWMVCLLQQSPLARLVRARPSVSAWRARLAAPGVVSRGTWLVTSCRWTAAVAAAAAKAASRAAGPCGGVEGRSFMEADGTGACAQHGVTIAAARAGAPIFGPDAAGLRLQSVLITRRLHCCHVRLCTRATELLGLAAPVRAAQGAGGLQKAM